ncbi:TniQ family protein [Mesobacillus selenatarsenatis]|uniref:Transcriptional regulator n=1 Tax=Mesobacillus selenatarsenatis (strain DSM 18680 / JCM 14380 / FERM P-15431 / SF-1) TaxID=1321606 RepID=A0A0A8X5F7_MESS1|nr:TniQ family protein [Mesobacillus selenatarsenatis]GAM14267.1 transcriptional regulator [Mesobacillus selenatarsenatis SF-1]
MTYQSFLKKRSILYDISPIGVGSAEVESITSYLIRLSYEHNLSVGQIVSKVLAPLMKKNSLLRSSREGGNRFYDGAKTLNGYMEYSVDLVNTIESATGRGNLGILTLQKWKEVIPLRELLDESLSWCPYCLRESSESQQTIYYPMIWNFKIITTCVHHQCELLKVCVNCNNKIPILHRHSIIGLCPNCGSKLDQFCSPIGGNREQDSWQSFVLKEIGELLAFDSLNDDKPIRNNIVSQLTQINDDEFSGNITSFSKAIKTPNSTIRSWISGDAIPTLESQLRICYALNISLIDFLLNRSLRVRMNSPITFKKDSNIGKVKKFDRELAEKKLNEYLTGNEIISMTQIAIEIGFNKRVLYRNFPWLCRQLSKRYMDLISIQKEKRLQGLKGKVNFAVETLVKQGNYPSRRKVEGYLKLPGLLKEREIQEFWKKLITDKR